MEATDTGDALKALDGNELVRRNEMGLCFACGKKKATKNGVYCDTCTVDDFRKHL